MDRLQEEENDYIRLIQQRTLKLNISPSAIPTTEEVQAAVEGTYNVCLSDSVFAFLPG
jgi:hypothetical protein